MQAVCQVGLEYSRGSEAEDTDQGVISMWAAKAALSKQDLGGTGG